MDLAFDSLDTFYKMRRAYGAMMGTRPQVRGQALTDSPAGLAVFMYDYNDGESERLLAKDAPRGVPHARQAGRAIAPRGSCDVHMQPVSLSLSRSHLVGLFRALPVARLLHVGISSQMQSSGRASTISTRMRFPWLWPECPWAFDHLE
jgi:hypothetical protein